MSAALSRHPARYDGPAAWRGPDYRGDHRWIYHLTAEDCRELETAASVSERSGVPLHALDAASFALPALGPKLERFRDEIVNGRGFQLIRKVPVERLGIERIARIYLRLGAHLGTPVSQNAMGHLLGHVCDLGRDVDDPAVRTYQTTARQFYHADSCDVVGLLCLRPAKAGGASSIVSSVTLYNEIAARRPDLAAALSEPIAIDRRGEVPKGRKPYFMLPVFNHHRGLVSCYYSRRYAESAQRFPEAPRLRSEHREAFDLLDQLVEDETLHLNMNLAPGDIQLLHNHTVLHDRTTFEDWPEPERRRHLLRLWLCPSNGRPLSTHYEDRWGAITIGCRGGIRVPGSRLNVPLTP